MKTPDEIKKGLEYCVQLACPLEECPYYDAESCAQDKTYDALAYIQQLEAANAELLTRCERLERERDAAVEILSKTRPCEGCKYRDLDSWDEPCRTCICGVLIAKPCWEWRGVKEE